MINFMQGRFLLLALAAPLLASTARANLYITNLRLNGAVLLTNSAAVTNINITYILNEPAAQGVTVQISSGSNLLRTLTAAPGSQGALFGSNVMVWDSTDSNGVPVPTGHYGVSLFAVAASRTNWTQISQDSVPGNYTHDPRGLAVNNNSNSFYYGRVFIGNAHDGTPDLLPGDQDTIIKLNADGTFAADGSNGDGGYSDMVDLGDFGVPQKMRVAEDDRLYMMDLNSPPQLVAFDMPLSTNEIVLSMANYEYNPFWLNGSLSAGIGWFSMDVTGVTTTNGLIWLGQVDADGAGIWNWNMTNGVADPTNDTGNWVVEVGDSLAVAASGGLMVDDNFDLFVGQYLTDSGDTNADCMKFPNWNDGLSYGGEPVSNGVAWSVGGGDNTFLGVYDTTIDSRQNPKFVACALTGGPATAGIRVLDAGTGTVVTNLDPTNQYFVTAWDNVGNLYGASGTSHLLRVFSPPVATNQASISGELQIVPAITSVTLKGTTLTIFFIGTAADQVSQIGLQSCPTVNGQFVDVTTGVTVQLISPGYFQLTTTVSAPIQYYRIRDAGAH
ncbi:MAG TPA: FlgD immunoglobulin-like domain containing protein [Candidatus Cybelea sp.]|jgi:hypothetical protein|nr:FlgD immunoglobulin-like domain containing protein [Candidatus Cybelea sp.]